MRKFFLICVSIVLSAAFLCAVEDGGGLDPMETGATYRLMVRGYKNPLHALETFDRLRAEGLNPATEKSRGIYWVVLAGIAPGEVEEVMDRLDAAGFPGSLVSETIVAEEESGGGEAETAFTEDELRSSVEEMEDILLEEEMIPGDEFDIGITKSAKYTWRRLAPRVFEWGINFDIGSGNNWIQWSDVFNSDKTINLDLAQLPKQAFGVTASSEPQTWFKFQSRGKHEIGVTLTAGLDIDAYAGLSQDLTDSIANGRLFPFDGSAESGASIFGTVELRGSAKIGKWKIFAAPELYIPLLYMEKPDIHALVKNDNTPKGELVVSGDIYTAFNMETMDFSDVLGTKGVNISLGAEYPLFSFLDVGGSVSHIPLVTATMTNKASFNIAYDINPDGSNLLDAFDNFFQEREGSSADPEYGTGSLDVYRPLRFDAYCVYKPLNFRMVNIAFRGNFGYSVGTIYGDCFNFGVSARADLLNIFGLELKTGCTEALWRHGVSLTANMKVVELDCGIAVQSQDFVKSFQTAGLQAAFGLRVGF